MLIVARRSDNYYGCNMICNLKAIRSRTLGNSLGQLEVLSERSDASFMCLMVEALKEILLLFDLQRYSAQ